MNVWGLNVEKFVLPDVLDGHKTSSLTLSEECTLRVIENRVLWRTIYLKGEKVTGDWREFYNEELHKLCSLQSVSKF
jgi:hypothetical protein